MQTLLRGGVVLTHDDNDHVVPIVADVLVEGNVIKDIAREIATSPEAKVVECKDKIICPGFIDTHKHLWQSLMKGQWADHTILDYICKGLFSSAHHDPNDIFWAQLGGCLECIDAGSTTVVDHAHFHYSPEHASAALAAFEASGLRGVFCYCPSSRLEKWDPLEIDTEVVADWMLDTVADLAQKSPFGDGRIQLGFGMDEFVYTKEKTIAIFEKVKSLGIKHFTSHYCRSVAQVDDSRIAMFNDWGLLDSNWIISHATNPAPGDADIIKKAGAHISSATSSAMGMAMGHPVALHHPTEDFFTNASIGTDSHAMNTSSIPMEMRLLLQDARASFSQPFVDAGKIPRVFNRTAEDAFNLGTVKGARAVGMADKIGSLKAGMLADIVLFDGTSPSMYGVAQLDPVEAIVVNSSQRDVELVMIDGKIRKERNKLELVQISSANQRWLEEKRDVLAWETISSELIKRSNTMSGRYRSVSLQKLQQDMLDVMGIDRSRVSDHV